MNAPTPRLVLFDVDGTLLVTGGATSRCILAACRELFGPQFQWGPITVGTLDPAIFADLCRHNGVADPAAHLARYHDCYCGLLERELDARRGDVTVMPGIAPLLALLARRGVERGIVTGNYGRATRTKLAAAGLDAAAFGVMAAAEAGGDRAALVRAAMSEAGVDDPRRVVVVGDTPRDVDCAAANGCRSLAVATGHYSVEQLRDAGADRVVSDFASCDAAAAVLDWTV